MGRTDLEMSRTNYCLAVRFEGHWGNVWPRWKGKKKEKSEDGNEDGIEENIFNQLLVYC